jgi:hypothetical protein
MATATAPPVEDQRKGPPERRAPRLIAVLTVFPGPLSDTGYTLKQSITVQLQIDEGGRFIVSEPSTGAFTSGNHQFPALAAFVGAFIEEFEFLAKNESTLSPAMLSDLGRFRTLIEPTKIT